MENWLWCALINKATKLRTSIVCVGGIITMPILKTETGVAGACVHVRHGGHAEPSSVVVITEVVRVLKWTAYWKTRICNWKKSFSSTCSQKNRSEALTGQRFPAGTKFAQKILLDLSNEFVSIEKIQMQDKNLPLIKVYKIASECMELHMLWRLSLPRQKPDTQKLMLRVFNH